MYEGLYNTRKGLSDGDRAAVGFMTAWLLLRWSHWVHRRVERITFADEDASRREISVDFTLPNDFHTIRGTPKEEARRQLVPLGFLRKGVLVNFSLRDESDASLPLLNAMQNAQVAEATLVSLAGLVLEGDEVSELVRDDIRKVVREDPDDAKEAFARLFDRPDPAHEQRVKLGADSTFRAVAEPMVTHFMALAMVDIRRHQRRIVHLSYEDSLWWDETAGVWDRFRRALRRLVLALGNPRLVLFVIPAVADTDSYHVEIEAPNGFKVSARESYVRLPTGATPPPTKRGGSYKRAHVYFPQASPGSQGLVALHILPRQSTIVRSAILAGLLILLTLAALWAQIDDIKNASDEGAAAAALLLSFSGLVGIYATQQGETPMVTALLWPIRMLAASPVVWAFISAVAVIASLGIGTTRLVLAVATVLTAISVLGLLVALFRIAALDDGKQSGS